MAGPAGDGLVEHDVGSPEAELREPFDGTEKDKLLEHAVGRPFLPEPFSEPCADPIAVGLVAPFNGPIGGLPGEPQVVAAKVWLGPEGRT